jgi:hypothetical protein
MNNRGSVVEVQKAGRAKAAAKAKKRPLIELGDEVIDIDDEEADSSAPESGFNEPLDGFDLEAPIIPRPTKKARMVTRSSQRLRK